MGRHDFHWLNRERLEVYPRIVLIIFVAITGSIFMRWIFGDATVHLPITDFSVYWVASYFWLNGHTLEVFNPSSFCGNLQTLVPASPCGYQWLYPPSFYLLILPLALMPYWAAYLSFMVASATGYVVVLRRLIKGRVAMWCLAAFPGLWINLLSGQNGCLTAALAGAALLNLERRPVLAGVFVGSLSIKPHLAVLFPVALVAAGSWRTFFVATGVALAWMILGTLILGSGALEGWLGNIGIARAILEWTETVRMMPTVFAFLRLSGASIVTAYTGQAIIAVITMSSIWMLWRRDIPSPLKYAALITGSMLVSPYLLEYDLAWLALPIAWLTSQGLKTGWLRWEREVLVTAWLTPVLCIALSRVLSIQLGSLALLALLLTIVRRSHWTERSQAPHG